MIKVSKEAAIESIKSGTGMFLCNKTKSIEIKKLSGQAFIQDDGGVGVIENLNVHIQTKPKIKHIYQLF